MCIRDRSRIERFSAKTTPNVSFNFYLQLVFAERTLGNEFCTSRSILTAFRFWPEVRESMFVYTFFPTFSSRFCREISVEYIILEFLWERLSRSPLTAFRLILTRILENHCSTFVRYFCKPFSILCLENSVSWHLIWSEVGKRLSRSILTSFRFRLEFRNSIFSHMFYFFEMLEFFVWKQVSIFFLEFTVEFCVGCTF